MTRESLQRDKASHATGAARLRGWPHWIPGILALALTMGGCAAGMGDGGTGGAGQGEGGAGGEGDQGASGDGGRGPGATGGAMAGGAGGAAGQGGAGEPAGGEGGAGDDGSAGEGGGSAAGGSPGAGGAAAGGSSATGGAAATGGAPGTGGMAAGTGGAPAAMRPPGALGERYADGVWVIEAEDIPGITQKGWVVGSEGNRRFVEFRGPGISVIEEIPVSSVAHRMELNIWFPERGSFMIRFLNKHNLHDGDNDLWWSGDRVTFHKMHDNNAGEWSYDDSGWVLHLNRIPVGAPTARAFAMAGRSVGFKLDKIVIYRVGTNYNQLPPGKAPCVDADLPACTGDR